MTYSETRWHYSVAIDDYKQLIEVIAKIIKELKLENNPLTLSIILHKLILAGYFSDDYKFALTTDGYFHDVKPYWGMDIIDGKGCCRHLASFQDDVFRKTGIFSNTLHCYITNSVLSLPKRKLPEDNHAINILLYDGIIYAYDCTTNTFYRNAEKSILSEIYNIKPSSIFYRTIPDSIVSENTTNKDKEFILKGLEKASESMDYNRYIDLKMESDSILRKNNSALRDRDKR